MSEGASAGRRRGGEASEHLELLRRVTEGMTLHRKLEDVLGAITRGLVGAADAALARIWLYTTAGACAVCAREARADPAARDARSLHLCASAGLFEDLAGPLHRVPLGLYLGGRVAETRAPLLLDDLQAEPSARELPWIAAHGLRGYAGYPLLFDGQLEGVLGIFRSRPWAPEEFRVLGIFASQAAIAIKTAALVEAVEHRSERLTLENAYLQDELRRDQGSGAIVGESPALREVLGRLERAAPTDTTVLLLGETGTGKELLARAVHAGSSRRDGPFIGVSCGAIPAGLVESELFGHERGAFTGAHQRRLGRFELADGGTLFLDEVGELPPPAQVKLLRALQEGEIERVGGTAPVRTDVRVVAATNRDLEAEVAAGRFRADLYYRLAVFPVRVPALRERAEDVPLLAEHFLAALREKLRKPLDGFAPESLDRLTRYPWPGNIRELRNVVERAAVLATDGLVRVGELSSPAGAPSALRTLEEVEREHVLAVLTATGGVIQGPGGAARILGLHPNTLRSRMERLGIRRAKAKPGG